MSLRELAKQDRFGTSVRFSCWVWSRIAVSQPEPEYSFGMAQHFKDLVAWKKAIDLVAEVYRVTDNFPRREVYSLTDQMRRAAVSVPSNIAEGQAHHSHREFLRFLQHSAGSLAELETQLVIAERLGYGESRSIESVLQKVHEVGRIVGGLMASLRERNSSV